MDTITHTLFGLTLYGAVNKADMSTKEKRVLLLTAVAGSQIPDIDVISAWWDTAGRYQMWHRGITHSIFLVPVWAGLIAGVARLFGMRGWLWFGLACLAVFIHNTSDLFNAWGTGYLEPFSAIRITFGTIPIVDLVLWLIMGAGLLIARLSRHRWQRHHVYRVVWLLMALHVAIQTAQGAALHREASRHYDQVALAADFVPGVFTVIAKQGHEVDIMKGTYWSGMKPVATLTSAEDADLDTLFAENPRAKTLFEWSPFVVVEDDGNRVGIYDPRFYQDGESFLYEYFDRDE